MVELKPCPFCGGKAEVVQVGSARQSTIYGCTDCHCQLETGEVFNIGVQWNTRADSLAIAAAVQAEREACADVARSMRGGFSKNMTGPGAFEDVDGPWVLNATVADAILARPAPAVDVLGVVREFVDAVRAREAAELTPGEWQKFDALAALVDGAAANNEGGK